MAGDSCVIRRRSRENFGGEFAPQFESCVARLTDLVRHNRIIAWVNYDSHAFMIFRRASQHRRPADIDVLYRLRERHSRVRNGLFKWIKVYHHKIDGLDPVFRGRSLVLRIRPHIEQPAVHLWMKGFDTAIEHLRKTSIGAQVSDRETSLAQGLRRAAR